MPVFTHPSYVPDFPDEFTAWEGLDPMEWDWRPFTQGDTYPATRITEDEEEEDLARVRIKVKDKDGNLLLDLDSDATGITIASSVAGAWDFTIDELSPVATAALPVGIHFYDLETTTASGRVFTDFAGKITVLPQQTD